MGELEGPSIWRLEFHPNPARHIVMQEPVEEPQDRFFRDVATRAEASERHECFVFVHGFNVGFEDAVRRTAQLSYDLAFDGPAVVFSWPSQGGPTLASYVKDGRNADLSADSLRQVLLALGRIKGMTIHLVAHSMGTRVASAALLQLASGPQPPRVKALGQVAMIAADMDAEQFRRAAGKLTGVTQRLTLYASSADEALVASRQFAGYKRAGEAGSDLVIVPDVDTIDATEVKTSVLGLRHQYYADNTTILSDLFHLLRGRPPQERGPTLERAGTPPKVFWRFRPTAR